VKFSAGRHLGEDRNICPDTPRDLR
jgi:hypothetical protein